MSNSRDVRRHGIPVVVHTKIEGPLHGTLSYSWEGPKIRLADGRIFDDQEGVRFRFQEYPELARFTKVDTSKQIILESEIVVKLNYTPHQTSRLQMYPPSTDGWLTHVVDNGNEAIFTIQPVSDLSKKLLTVIDPSSKEFYFAGFIQPYEASILKMDRDLDVHNKIRYSEIPDADILNMLNEKSFGWPTLSKLIAGTTIRELTLGKTMEETITQIVPESFPSNVRKQIIAFLSWSENARVPREDPLEFVLKYSSVGVFRALARGHIQCLIENVAPPKYVQVMHMADKGLLEQTQRPQPEAVELDPWNLARERIEELFPSWMAQVVKSAIVLQEKGKIITELPISREDAVRSRGAWSSRFAMAHHGLFMRGHVFKESIGLIPAIYIGGAHRWPHKHLEWTCRLGYGIEKPQYIQIMVMPYPAFERVSRILPSIMLIDWEMSSFNLPLYNETERSWKLKENLLCKSLERKRSLKQLQNEFGSWKNDKPHLLNREQVKILDMISWGLYIDNLENKQYSKYYGISNVTIKQQLELMNSLGIFRLQFFLIPEKLRSLCIIANGPSNNICSLSRAFLKYTPSTQVKVSNQGKTSVIFSRVPEDKYYNLAKKLLEAADESELTLRIEPISAYVGYRNNLYFRLKKDDAKWDDNVSGLLDQVRLSSKNTN